MQYITLLDYFLLPFYLVIIFVIANNFRNKNYQEGHPWRPYFMSALMIKMGGSIFISMLYQYYYHGGDTTVYFTHSKVINSAFWESPLKWFNLLFRLVPSYSGDYIEYTSQLYWYDAPANYLVATVSALAGMLTFNCYLENALLFAVLSFTGSWAIFRTFASQYPHLTKHIAIAVLYIPSTFIWGSGLFKDTICMFGLGWMLYGTFQFLIQRKFSLKTILLTVIGFYLIVVIKVYIVLAFIPALGLWIVFTYSHKIKSSALRTFIKTGFAAVTILGFVYAANTFSSELGSYSLEKIATTSTVTRNYIESTSGDESSGYSLGDIEPNLGGMLKKLPLAVNVTLFRPYIWESRKPIIFLNALEAFLFLAVTLKILFVIGPVKVWKAISSDPNIQFLLIFTIIFAFAVGISTYNFGALSRYRIPCLPPFALALTLIYYRYKSPEERLLSL